MRESPTNSRGKLQNNSPKKVTESQENSPKNSQKLSQKLPHKNPTFPPANISATNVANVANLTSQKSSLKKSSPANTSAATESSAAAKSSAAAPLPNISATNVANLTSQKSSLKKSFPTNSSATTSSPTNSSVTNVANLTSQKSLLKKSSAAESSATTTAVPATTTSAQPLKKLLAKVAITFSIIAISLMVTALSCQKKDLSKSGTNNNANNSSNNDTDNSGNNPTPNPNPKPIDLESFSSGNLQIEIATSNAHFIKLQGNDIYINAKELAKKVDIVADPQDDQRGFRDLISKKNRTKIFSFYFPGHTVTTPKVAMFFLFRPHVNKNNLTLDAPNTCTNNSESADNALATNPGGGICRSYTQGGVTIHLESFLGTVFDNTDTTRARGLVQCESDLQNIIDPIKNLGKTIDDTTVFNRPNKMDCFLGVVNNGGTHKNQTLHESWALDSNSTPAVDFYAMGINVTGKLISAWSIESGFNLSKFNEALDNTAIKKILKATDWRDRSFTVRIVSDLYFKSL